MPATLPISDEEAAVYLDRFPNADDTGKKIIGGLLLDYQDQQLAAQNQARTDFFEGVYTDPVKRDAFWNQPSMRTAADATSAPDATKMRATNQAFLAHVEGLEPTDLDSTYEIHRDQKAKEWFGKPSMTDEAFFNAVSGQQKQVVDTRKAVEEVPSDVVSANIEDMQAGKPFRSPLEIVNAWKQAHPDLIPSEGDESNMVKAATSYAQDTSAFMQKYTPQVKAVFDTLAGFSNVGNAPDKDVKDVQSLADQISSMPPEDRQKLYGMAELYARKNAAASPDGAKAKAGQWANNLGESVLRGVTGVARGASAAVVDRSLHSELAMVQNGINPDRLTALRPQEIPPLTPDEQKTKAAEIQKKLDGVQVARELFDVAQNGIDPIKDVSSGWMKHVEDASYMLGGAAPLVGAAFIPYVGAPIVGAAIASTEYNRIRLQYPDVPINQAEGMAAVSGAAQAAIFGLRASTIVGKLPWTGKFLDSLAKPTPDLVGGIIKRTAAGAALSTAEQAGQQGLVMATPAIVDGLSKSLGADMPGFSWKEQFKGMEDATPAALLSIVPFVLLGTAGIGFAETKRGRAMLSDPASLASSGIDPVKAQAIAAEPDLTKKTQMFQAAWKGRTPEQIKASVAMANAATEAAKASQEAEGTPSVRTRTNENGETVYTTTDAQGKPTYETTDQDAAIAAHASDLQQHQDTQQNVVGQLVQYFQGVNERRGVDAKFEVGGKAQTGQEFVDSLPEENKPAAIDQLRERLRIEAKINPDLDPEGSLSSFVIDGQSEAQFKEGIFTATNRIAKGADPLVVVQEHVETETKRALAEGRVSMDWLRSQLQSYEQASGESLMTGTDQSVIEGVSTLAQSYVAGKLRDPQLPTGLRAYFRQMVQVFKHVFVRAAKLKKAIRDGKVGKDFETFLAQSIGLDDEAQIAKVRDSELARTFSISRVEKIDENTGLPLNDDGTVTLYHGTTKEAAEKIKKDGVLKSAAEPDVYFTTAKEGTGYGDGTVIAVNVDPSKLQIDDEFPDGRKDFRATVGKSKQLQVTHSIKPAEYSAKLDAALAKLETDPELRKDMIQRARKDVAKILESAKELLPAKETDPTEALHRIEQDRAANIADLDAEEQSALDANRLDNRDDKGKQINRKATSEKQKAIKQAFSDKRKAVETKARTESERVTREAELANRAAATDYRNKDSRASTIQAMGLLEAIIRKLPMEARGRIGGFSELSKQTTDAARVKFIINRIEKVGREMEDWLKDFYTGKRDKLFKRSMPAKNEAGKKIIGKAGSDIHSLFDTLRDAVDWTPEKALGYISGLESEIASGELTPEQESHKQLEAELVGQFADWTNASADRRAAAVDNANNVFSKGYSQWLTKKVAEREVRAEQRNTIIAETGKAGTRAERDETLAKDNGAKGVSKAALLNLSSFEQVVHFLVGKKSAVGKDIVEKQIKADNEKADAVDEKSRAVYDFWTKQAGGKLKGEQLLYDLSTKKTVTFEGTPWEGVKLSEMEGVAATLLWRREQGKMHMIGRLDDNGKPAGGWHYNQDFVDKVESQLSDDAKAWRDWLAKTYAAEHSEINPIYKQRYGINLPNDPNYYPISASPLMVKSNEVADPITGAPVTAGATTPSSLRALGNSAAEPKFEDSVQTYLGHFKQLEHWKAYGQFANDLAAILNHLDTRNAIQAAGGLEALAVSQKWVNYFAQGGTVDAAAQLGLSRILRHLVGNAAGVALVGRATVLGVQATQLGAALAEMPTGAYLTRFAKLFTGQLGWKDAINSDYIHRRLSEKPPMVRELFKGLALSRPNRIKYFYRQIGELINGADALFTAGTYAMVLDHQRGELAKAGFTGSELETRAHQEAVRITDRVAQPMRPGARSIYENVSTGPLATLSWAFASESRQKAALGAWAVAGKDKPLGERARALAVAWIVAGVGSTILRAAVKDATDPSDDELFDEKHWNPKRLLLASMTGPLQGIPVLGDNLTSAIYSAAGVYQPSGNILSSTQNASGAIKRIPETLTGQQDFLAVMKDVDSILSALGVVNEDAAALAGISHAANALTGAAANAKKSTDAKP